MKERKLRPHAISWLMLICLVVSMMWMPVKAEAADEGNWIYVSQEKGSDAGEGTKESPYKTINKAAQVAQPGDVVIVQKGVYRECVRPARGGTSEDKRITYMAEEPGQAVIKGSEQITTWEKTGEIWKVVLQNDEMFGDYNPYTKLHGKDTFDYFPVYNCGDVYLNEEAYYQKKSVADVEANTRTWYSQVDEEKGTTTIYANFGKSNPNEELAEINVRQQCFAPVEWGLAYITVNGFKVAHSANMYSDFPGYPEHCQSGAISTNGGLKWIIENNTIVNARSIAIDIGLRCDMWAGNRDPRNGNAEDKKYFTSYKDTEKYGQHIVRNNLIQKSGQCGIAGVFSWKSQILDNVIEDTNYRNEFIAAETGGIKVHYCNDGLIKGNYVRNTVGGGSAGIWTDWGNQGIRITQNVLVNNNWGYYCEAVVGPILVDNNIFIDNNIFRSLDGAGVTFANNLFFNETMSYDGSGRNCMVFEPHTMNDSEVYSKPQYFRWFNNISINKTIAKPKGENNVMEGNIANAGTDFQYQATTDSVKISFSLKEDPKTGEQTMVNPALVGIIQPAGEGIGDIVNTDYFGNAYDADAMIAGPFADMKQGENTYTVWPRSEAVAPPSTAEEEENLALGKKAWASSEVGDNTADKAVDGSTGSRFESAQTDNEWFAVDLGESTDISQIKILWESAYAKAYKILLSDDNENWKEVYATTEGDGGTDLLEIQDKGRYIRLECSERALPYGYSLYEFQVFGNNTSEEATAPVFQKMDNQTVKEGENLSFKVTAEDAGNKTVTYQALGYLPAGAVLNGATGEFSWTPDSTQSGRYVVSFLADNGEASAAFTMVIDVEDALEADETAPVWQEGSSITYEASQDSMSITWPAATDDNGVSSYLIYRDGLLYKEVAGDVTQAEITGLEAENSYQIVITAKDVWGNTVSVEDGLSLDAKTLPKSYGSELGISKTYPKTYSDWANAFVAGDGKIGMMVFGNPLQETVIMNDRKFFMAATVDKPNRVINTVSQEDLNQIKEYLVNEQWKEANDLANKVHGWQDGGEGNKHPGYEMLIHVLGESGDVQDYSRVLDYSTGEITVSWKDDRGAWERKAFVSRQDNVAVEYLTNPSDEKTFGCSVQLTTDPGMHLPDAMEITDASTEEFLNFRAVYPNAGGAGYEGVTKVITDGTNTLDTNGIMTIQDATYVLLLTKNEKYYSDCEEGWNAKTLQSALDELPASYEALMEGQIKTHKEIYDRVDMTLDAPAEDRLLTNEELLQKQKNSAQPVLALYEKIFAAGRYHYLSSSSSTSPPDLLGLWTGDTNVGWSGYYHLDANLNLQISSGNIGNMPEAMEGYFYLMDAWKDDFRTNAQKLLGCRGFLSGGNSPGEVSGIISALNYAYPYQYVTGGEAWLIYPFWEYYEITRDEDFLRDRIYPYLKEMGNFYEDFLTEKDENGKYIFAGSISPESQPQGLGLSLVNNSTFDITGAQFLLSKLVQTCEILGIQESEETPVSRWQQILDDLPPYLINDDGALSEWSWPSLRNSDNYGHRHSSHLIGVWPYRTITAEDTPELYKAAQTALQKKDAYSYENAGHGILHSALIATNLNDGESAGAKILRLLKDGFYFDSLTTAHYNNQGVFCTDVANTVPGIMMEMCMSSSEDTLELLPAIPAAMNVGSISGLKAKCQITLNEMEWDLNEGTIDCTITSDVDQTITLIQRSGIVGIETDAGIESSDLGDIAKKISLKAGEATKLQIELAEDGERNLALNKPAYASSESNSSQTAAQAVDGNMGTRWGASEAEENWIYVDLEDSYDITKVNIYWEDSYAKRYKLQVSDDKENWTDVYTNEDNQGGRNEINLKATGRYVRMLGLEKSGQWGYSIYELEVYGTLTPPPVNLALNKPAKSMNYSNESTTPDRAFDGSTSTRWGCHEDDDNWLSVDLEDTYVIKSVVINWEDSYAKEYKIQVSSDEENWIDVYETHDSPGGIETIQLETPVEARYVKMQGIKKAGQWGYSIWEMEVYGEELPPPENVALNKPATASTESNASQPAQSAFDGDQDTRWGAHEDADNWLMVDLQAYYDLVNVKIYWEDSYAKGYKIQGSLDGVHWQDLYVEENNEGGVNDIPVEGSFRYVKMQGVEKSGIWGYSIWEMEVYGRLSANQNPALNHAPVVQPVEDKTVTLGETLTFTLEATDEDEDVLSYTMAQGAPETAQLDAQTGSFRWTPEAAGTYEITFVVSDGTDDVTITVTIVVEESSGVSKEELLDLIGEAGALDEALYTPESFEKLQTALDAAKALAEREDATQDEIDRAVMDLQTAIDGLEMTDALAEAIKKAQDAQKTAEEAAKQAELDQQAAAQAKEEAQAAMDAAERLAKEAEAAKEAAEEAQRNAEQMVNASREEKEAAEEAARLANEKAEEAAQLAQAAQAEAEKALEAKEAAEKAAKASEETAQACKLELNELKAEVEKLKAEVEAAKKRQEELENALKDVLSKLDANNTNNNNPPAQTEPEQVKKGQIFTVGALKYKITSVKGKTVSVVGTDRKALKNAVIPATVKINGVSYKVTAIAKNAFKNYKTLTKITIGKNVKKIGSNAFYKNSKLKKVTVKSKILTSVGKNAFKGIQRNAYINVPNKKAVKYRKVFKNAGQPKNVKIK